jgi:hypothetical protein
MPYSVTAAHIFSLRICCLATDVFLFVFLGSYPVTGLQATIFIRNIYRHISYVNNEKLIKCYTFYVGIGLLGASGNRVTTFSA